MLKSKKVLARLFLVSMVGIGLIGCGTNESTDEEIAAPEEVVDEVEEAKTAEHEETAEADETTQMVQEADYISKIKLITKGKNNTEIKVLDNIKAVLSAADLPSLDLKENRVYLVFLKDDGDEVVLVNGDESVILLEGDQHELFEKINQEVHQ